MSSSRLPPRASPSRLKQSAKIALEPAQIPLPPSPPASDPHVITNPFAPRSCSPHQRPLRTSCRTKPSPAPKPSRRENLRALEGSQLPLNQAFTRTRSKRLRVAEDRFDSSSPPTSPTNRKSTRSTKRLKLSSPSPSRRSLRFLSTPDQRDSPNNPFLSKPDEKPRRADSRREDGQRHLVYVFRGKRIPLDDTEDLSHAGGSPFNLSGPKLLFPSPPTPPPVPKIKFQDAEGTVAGSSSLASPTRRNQDRNQLAFQTPKRDKTKSNLGEPIMLPTPQSRPRRTKQNQSTLPTQALAGVVKSSKTMSKAMR